MNRRATTGKVFWAWCFFTLTVAVCLGMGSNNAQAAPTITSPTPGSTLTGSTETFSWADGGSVVTEWWLYVGTSPGERDIYNSRSLGTATSDTVSVLPINGATLHVRLWFRINGEWKGTNFTYTAFASGGSGGGLSAMPPWDQVLPAAERFVLVMGGKAVLDKETGRVWEQSPDTEQRTWEDAMLTCVNRHVGGRQGWRLPSVFELGSLRDGSVSPSTPQLPVGHPFSNIHKAQYWTSTTDSTDPLEAYQIRFQGGPTDPIDKTFKTFTWCVRSGAILSVY